MTAIALVQKVKNFPPVSQAALKMISLLDKASVDNDDIVQVLKYDNVLTAKLLKACNAPSFGLGEPVASGEFLNNESLQSAPFAKPASGRYVKLEAISSVSGEPYTAIGELDLDVDAP